MTMDQAIEQGFMDGEWYHVITGEFTINNNDFPNTRLTKLVYP